MRNLAQYPITVQEMVEVLRKEADWLDRPRPAAEMPIGDIRPMIFRNAATIIERLGFVTYDLPGMEGDGDQ